VATVDRTERPTRRRACCACRPVCRTWTATASLALPALLCVVASPALAWVTTVRGQQSLSDAGYAVAVDQHGDALWAQGNAVVKIAGGSGAEIWRAPFEPSDLNAGALGAGNVTLDDGGDVYAGGTIIGAGGAYDTQIVKLSGASGRILWSSTGFIAVSVGPSGEVVAVNNTHSPDNMVIARLSPIDGSVFWQTVIDGPAHGQDQVLATRIDGQGDVFVAGDMTTALGDEFVVLKLSGTTGRELWRSFLSGPDHNGQAFALALDPAGDVVAAGAVSSSASGFDMAVVKLAGPTGLERWHAFIDGGAGGFDFGRAVAIDASGGVLVGGTFFTAAGGNDLGVARLSASGEVVWRSALDGGAGSNDNGQDIALVGPDVTIVGTTYISSEDGTQRLFAATFDGATGATLWRYSADGTTPNASDGSSVAALGADAVLVSGTVTDRGQLSDAFLARLDRATGSETWRSIGNTTEPGPARATGLALSPSGDPVVVGTIFTADGGGDLGAVKLAAGSGAQRWRATFDGGPGLSFPSGEPPGFFTDQEVAAAAIAYGGDVLVCGRLIRLAPIVEIYPGGQGQVTLAGVDFTVLALDLATGVERWRAQLPGSGRQLAACTGIAVDAAGGVLATGVLPFDDGVHSGVIRLDPATGAELWRTPIGQAGLEPFGLNVEPSGAIVADGDGGALALYRVDDVSQTPAQESFSIVARLSVDRGEVLWAESAPGLRAAHALSADGAGNAIVAGADPGGLAVVKLTAADGSPLWTSRPTAGVASAIVLTAQGDAIVAGSLPAQGASVSPGGMVAARLAGGSGATEWTTQVTGDAGGGAATAVALDLASDVLLAGSLHSRSTGDDLAVVKLGGSDGGVLWREVLDGGAKGDDQAVALAVTPARQVVIAGNIATADGLQAIAVASIDDRAIPTGGPGPASCRRLRSLSSAPWLQHPANAAGSASVDPGSDVELTPALVARVAPPGCRVRFR